VKVSELIKWLEAFEDQDATVEVTFHTYGTGYYDQGGNATVVPFDPEKHTTYTDLRGNPRIAPGAPGFGTHTLHLGGFNE
jgi:hypothetical protein